MECTISSESQKQGGSRNGSRAVVHAAQREKKAELVPVVNQTAGRNFGRRREGVKSLELCGTLDTLIVTLILNKPLTPHVTPIRKLDEMVPDLNTIDLNTLNVPTLVLATFETLVEANPSEILVETNPSETNPLNHSMKL